MRDDFTCKLARWALTALMRSVAGFRKAVRAAEFIGDRYTATTAQDTVNANVARTNVEWEAVKFGRIEGINGGWAAKARSSTPVIAPSGCSMEAVW
jgi:hypothetical protein